MKTRNYQWVMGVALATVLGSCGSKTTTTEVTQDLPKVKVTEVISSDVEQLEEYTAIVESDVVNNISPQSYLRIEKLYVEVGDRVSKGQLLAQLDESSLTQLKLQIDNQQVEFSRTDELFKVGGASKAEWDNAKTTLEVMKTQYKNLLENSQLRSPITGVITARNYDNGDMTSTRPVFVVQQDQPVKMLINVSETKYPLMKKGMKVDVKLDTYGNETFEGIVNIVYPAVDSRTHTFPVEVRIPNNDRRARPGMFGRVTVNFGIENHVIVPDEAVVKQAGSGDRYVFVLNADNTVSYNMVTLGRRIGTQYELISGVEAGSTVIVAGQNKLANGMKVNVVK